VSAKDKGTGKENKITIKANSGLSDDEVERMVKDAEAHAEEDQKARALVEARNQCDALVHSVRKTLTEHGDQVSEEEKGQIEQALKEAEEALKSNDKDAIEGKTQALATASQKLAEKMYAQGQQQQPGGEGAGAEAGNEGAKSTNEDADVVDAEFEEVKDNKKSA